MWPPDGLNLKQGTSGELFGYGYLPLPLTEPKAKTNGVDVPTGNQCWTLFLDTATFHGPVTFFVPYFFSSETTARPELAGLFLDTRPANPNRALQMETQYVPAAVGTLADGRTIARIAPTRFPIDANGDSILVHRITSYRRDALWNAVGRWFAGGPVADGRIDPEHGIVHDIPGKGWSTWRIHTPAVQKDQRVAVDWQGFATPFAADAHTFGYRFGDVVRKDAGLATLPEFFVLEGEGKAARWRPLTLAAADVPAALRDAALGDHAQRTPEPYVTPTDGCWATPGPVAGPFEARLGDGSVVTYRWYRFADQPALQNADLTAADREQLQQRVELLHRHWTKERAYLPPPTRGRLAELDPALLVVPPKGFEVGYVPIATRQAAIAK